MTGVTDMFYITASKSLSTESVTKRTLVSDIAKVFHVFGWFVPTVISMKILLQRVWEEGIDWDYPVPEAIRLAWQQWRSPYCARAYLDAISLNISQVSSLQIHGLSDASKEAWCISG